MRLKEYKNIKKEIDTELSARKYERDEENRIIISMTVTDDSNFLSPFSQNSIPVISTDVADFIENNTRALPPSEPLNLQIHSSCINGEKKSTYKKAIKEYYSEKYLANEKEIKKNYIIALALLLAGIFVMTVSIFLNEHNVDIWSYVVDIAAWVLLWESIDISLLANRTLSLQRKKCISYLSMEINYIDSNEHLE